MNTKVKPITKELKIGTLQVVVNNKLGVDNIKVAFTDIINVTELIAQLTKKFSPRPLVELGFKLADYEAKIEIFKMALAEFRDLTPDESREISAHFNTEFDIKNDELEMVIERGIEMLPRTYEHIKNTAVLYLDWKDFAKDLKPYLKKKAA